MIGVIFACILLMLLMFGVPMLILYVLGLGIDQYEKGKAEREDLLRQQHYIESQRRTQKLFEQWEASSKDEQYDSWKQKRGEFSYIKHSSDFREWRREQYRCQDHHCAWCQKYISEKSYYTHIDHILPLFCGGTNDFSNMVLCCDKCNTDKGIKVRGYNNGTVNGKPTNDEYNASPSWIKINKYEK